MKWPPPVVLPSLTIMPLSSSPSSPSQSHALHPRARRARARISWPARHDLVPPRSRPLCLPSPAIELGSLSSMSGGSRWSSGPREGILGWRTEEELRASMAGRGTRGHGSSVPWLLAAAEGTSRRTGCEARIGKAPSSDLESVEGGGGLLAAAMACGEEAPGGGALRAPWGGGGAEFAAGSKHGRGGATSSAGIPVVSGAMDELARCTTTTAAVHPSPYTFRGSLGREGVTTSWRGLIMANGRSPFSRWQTAETQSGEWWNHKYLRLSFQPVKCTSPSLSTQCIALAVIIAIKGINISPWWD
jgi:hypothetical protein